MSRGRFDFAGVAGENGNSAFGQARGLDLRVDVPFSTDKVKGIDLTHIIHTDEVAAAKGGPGGGGGGGGGGTSTFAPYTSGAEDGAAGYDITIQFQGSWTQAYYDIFVAAADLLTTMIIGDLQNVSIRTKGKV